MYKNIKNYLDVILSLIAIIVLSPFLIVIYLVLLFTGVKPIFKQIRSGKNRINFVIYKFTTMKNEKITKIGKYLRLYAIDELPQLINIIKGDMSIIGPRPWITEYSKYFNKEQTQRLSVKPGLIGLEKVSKAKDVFEKIEIDLYYIKNISIKMDLSIFIKAILLLFSKNKKDHTSSDIKNEIKSLKNQKKQRKEIL